MKKVLSNLFIQHKLDELTLNQNFQSIWFILPMKFTNWIIGVKRDPDEVHSPASIGKKEEDKEDAISKTLYWEKRSQEFLISSRLD